MMPHPEKSGVIAALCAALIHRWEHGGRPIAEEYLLCFPGLPSWAAWELVQAEMTARSRLREEIHAADIVRRFPMFEPQIRCRLAQLEAARLSKSEKSESSEDESPTRLFGMVPTNGEERIAGAIILPESGTEEELPTLRFSEATSAQSDDRLLHAIVLPEEPEPAEGAYSRPLGLSDILHNLRVAVRVQLALEEAFVDELGAGRNVESAHHGRISKQALVADNCGRRSAYLQVPLSFELALAYRKKMTEAYESGKIMDALFFCDKSLMLQLQLVGKYGCAAFPGHLVDTYLRRMSFEGEWRLPKAREVIANCVKAVDRYPLAERVGFIGKAIEMLQILLFLMKEELPNGSAYGLN